MTFTQGPLTSVDCPSLTPPAADGTLSLTQSGAKVQGTFQSAALAGTLTESYHLDLTSSGSDTTFVLDGQYAPVAVDGGTSTYTGTFTATIASLPLDGGTSSSCTATGPFTAIQQ